MNLPLAQNLSEPEATAKDAVPAFIVIKQLLRDQAVDISSWNHSD